MRKNVIAIDGNLHYTAFLLDMQEKNSLYGNFFMEISQSHLSQKLCTCRLDRILPRPAARGVIEDGFAETHVLRGDFDKLVFYGRC